MFSGTRILTIRKGKGFSQELLAEQSGVSLRTIQRVEQGETVPRGHTLQALAKALGVTLADFRPEPQPAPSASLPADLPFAEPTPASAQPADRSQLVPAARPGNTLVSAPAAPVEAEAPAVGASLELSPLQADPDFLQLLNLSALSLLVLPLLNILVPFVLWRRHRRTILHAAEVGRRVLGFQILWQVGCFFAYLGLMLAYQGASALHLKLWRGGFLAVLIGSYLLNVLTVLYYAARLRTGDLQIYRFRV